MMQKHSRLRCHYIRNMRAFIGLILVLVGLVVAQNRDLPLAEPCDQEACQLPNCRCSTNEIPGGLNARDTPQFVSIAFSAAINTVNIETYRGLIYHRSNVDGCTARATFYVRHEYNNYILVNELYNEGFEIGLNSMTYQTPQSYWAEADYETLMKEYGDQKKQLAHFSNIPVEDIKGVRQPFMQMSGNSSFQVMADTGLVYDNTWTDVVLIDNALWPYTLDYSSIQACVVPPCPTASIPGVWVAPIVAWVDLEGTPCGIVDSCHVLPDVRDEEGWFEFIVNNFERRYLSNRAPFSINIQDSYLFAHPAVERAFSRFLDLINILPDVFMVSANDIIDWVKEPIPINQYKEKPCRNVTNNSCRDVVCGPLPSEHNEMTYWMSCCTSCPVVYPWLGNPFGR